MGTRTKKDYNDHLAIWNEMKALDEKNYDYYDRLTPEQQKEFSTYLLMRWGSLIETNGEISNYYAVAMNEFVNTNFWDLSKHKKLQWLCLCTVSPRLGKQKHGWLGAAKRNKTNPLRNKLLELLPTAKEKDIDLMLKFNSVEEIKEWLRTTGLQEKEPKLLV